MRTLFNSFRSLNPPAPTSGGSPRVQPLSPPPLSHARACAVTHTHTLKDAHTTPHSHSLAFRVRRLKGMNIHYLQALVTAKLLATSKLSMCGVSLNSEVEN